MCKRIVARRKKGNFRYVEKYGGILNTSIIYIVYNTSAFLVQNLCIHLDYVSNVTPIVPLESAPATINRLATFPLDEPSAAAVSYTSNQTYSSLSIPTAPLESPRDVQPYIFPTTATKDDLPSYAEAISTQNSPRPRVKEM